MYSRNMKRDRSVRKKVSNWANLTTQKNAQLEREKNTRIVYYLSTPSGKDATAVYNLKKLKLQKKSSSKNPVMTYSVLGISVACLTASNAKLNHLLQFASIDLNKGEVAKLVTKLTRGSTSQTLGTLLKTILNVMTTLICASTRAKMRLSMNTTWLLTLESKTSTFLIPTFANGTLI